MMSDAHRIRLILHGDVVVLVGLLAGFGAVTDSIGETGRSWTSVHQTLMLVGIWILVTGSVSSALKLSEREAWALVVALVGTGYAQIVSLFVQAGAGVRGIAPEGPFLNWFAFALNMLVVLGGLLAATLTVLGARAALRDSPAAS
jgi:hypothetical protein